MSSRTSRAHDAIEDVFSDKSVSMRETLTQLEVLRDQIDGNIDALKDDIKTLEDEG